MQIKSSISNILFWSVLSAAFIGPGTITTAASAGTGFGYTLIWALIFSTIACVVLQEASARLTIASGQNLGQAIRHKMSGTITCRSTGYLVLVSILTGCAAYEAGNILGAVAGAALIINLSTVTLTLFVGLIAFLLLWFGSTKLIAQILGIVVAMMGLCFLTTAIIMQPSIIDIMKGAFVPRLPTGSEILVIGLIGTTVVPYNLFLGSGLRHSQTLKEMRLSLTAAVVLGGIVSIGVLIVGTSIAGEFTYNALSESLETTLGSWASVFFATGLAAAGISSALTAPLAAALTARSMLGDASHPKWKDGGSYMRLTWGTVLLIGILFGVMQIQPIPAIILAQALNGIILPLIAVFLLLMVNNSTMLEKKHINTQWYNILSGIIVFITFIIGLTNLAKALSRLLNFPLVYEQYIIYSSILLALLLAWPLFKKISAFRQA